MRQFARAVGGWLAIVASLGIMAIWNSSGAVASTERRVALVIGNSNYQNTVSLPNTKNDAEDMSNALVRLGFDVITGIDLDFTSLNVKLREFVQALDGADLGLFYYAGHAMQANGENYVIPIDATLSQEADLQFAAVRMDNVLGLLQDKARIKVVILDACRDNPLSQSMKVAGGATRSVNARAGLAEVANASASGTVIVFATSPHTVALDGTGRNSPFTSALLNHIETPSLDIDLMFKRVRGEVARTTNGRQQPWTNSALNGEYYLAGGYQVASAAGGAGLPAPAGSAAPVADQGASVTRGVVSAETAAQIDLQLWQAAQAGGTLADYEAYLRANPTGAFVTLARTRVAALQRQANPAPTTAPGRSASATTGVRVAAVPTYAGSTDTGQASGAPGNAVSEAGLNLDREAWRDIQARLYALGHSQGRPDGKPGNKTRSAVRSWQAAVGQVPSGYLTGEQYALLLSQPVDLTAVPSYGNANGGNGVIGSVQSRSTTRRANSGTRNAARTSSRSSRRSGNGAGAEAAGRFVGGVIRGVAGRKFGF